MAGKSNKLKIKKLQINFTDKWFYTFVVVISLIAIGIGVYATTPNPGHDITQIAPPSVCGDNQFLKWTGSSWTCATVTSTNGVGSLWNQAGSDIYYNDGNVGIGTGRGPAVPLDILGTVGNAAIRIADSSTDSSTKNAKIVSRHYTNLEEDVLGLQLYNSATVNSVRLGGTSSNQNAATEIIFYTAADTTTVTGTERMRIDSTGKVGIGITDPVYELDVNGYVKANRFIGDGSGLINIVPRFTEVEEGCTENTHGVLRYVSSMCSGEDVTSSYFDICMRTGDSSYAWHNIKTNTWRDTACDTDGCPEEGMLWYDCEGEFGCAEPGCYYYKPDLCYIFECFGH